MMKKVKEFMIGFTLMATVILSMILCCVSKENTFKKEKMDRSEIVEDIIYKEHHSGHNKDSYNFKCYWKNDELLYVTVDYSSLYEISEGNYRNMYYVELYDNNLNLVKGLGSKDADYVWEEIYQLAEGLWVPLLFYHINIYYNAKNINHNHLLKWGNYYDEKHIF